MRSLFALLTSVLVPISGLISCNRNPATPPVVEDSWQLPLPQVLNNGTVQDLFLRSRNAATQPLAVDAEIIFQSEHELEQTTLEFKTECRTPQNVHASHISIKDANRVPVSSLIPLSLIHKLNLDELNQSVCELKIYGRNRIGSVHSLRLPSVQFTETQKIENLRIEGPKGPVSEIYAKKLEDLRIPKSLSRFKRVEAELICDRFRNHRIIPGPTISYENLINELINGELQPAIHLSPEPRSSFKRQFCRLVARAYRDSSGIPHLMASKVFQLRYPLTEASVTGTIGFDYSRVDSNKNLLLSGMKLFEIEIENRSKVPVAFQFPQTVHLNFQFIIRFDEKYFRSRAHLAPVNTILSGPTKRWTRDNQLIFELAPGKKAKIEGHINAPYACLLYALSPAESEQAPGKFLLVGFAYTFNRNPLLSQLSDWDPASPNISSPAIPRFTLARFMPLESSLEDLRTDESGTFVGWSPSPSWKQVSGDGQKPPTQFVDILTEGICR